MEGIFIISFGMAKKHLLLLNDSFMKLMKKEKPSPKLFEMATLVLQVMLTRMPSSSMKKEIWLNYLVSNSRNQSPRPLQNSQNC